MVEWAATDETVYALGRGGEVRIDAPGWEPGGPCPQLPYPVDAAVAGTADGLRLPTATARLTDAGGRPVTARTTLSDGEHALAVDAAVETHLRFEGPATLDPDGDGLAVEFPGPTAVALGFRETVPNPDTLSVPASPAGVAAAVTVAGADHADRGPERSHPAYRARPPRIEYDDCAPPESNAETDLRFRLPEDLKYVFVAAPLAYYLGAEVVVEERDAPLLTASGVGFEQPFGSLPAFATEVSAACRRVFHLDCLARDLRFEDLDDTTLFDRLGLDAAPVREAEPAVRYATFLAAPVGVVDDHLPRWHFSTYVDATYERARTLPYLLDRLSLVYPAEASTLDGRDLLERSLDDFYRGDVVSVQPLAPELGAGEVHAWLADGEPVDAFKTTPAAHEHRDAARPSGESIDVTVVLNDPEMEAELAAADVYRERAADLPVSLSVRRSLTRAELARVFETPADFVHYVGHCEVEGLECTDGYLSIESLDASRARTFFLNACGSYREGEALVERGSVAGGVTLDRVLDGQATTVGTAFARLVVHGFGIERALSLARRRVMMGKDYAVVGDGTYALKPACGDPAVLRVASETRPEGGVREDGHRAPRRAAENGFHVEYAVHSTRGAGRSYADPLTGGTRLYGVDSAARLTREELVELLCRRSLPAIYEGDLRWSDELAAVLATGATPGREGAFDP